MQGIHPPDSQSTGTIGELISMASDTRRIEDLVRRWAEMTPGDIRPPERPTPDCLNFAQAERIARRAGPPLPEVQGHLDRCGTCRKLVADFAAALAEEGRGAGVQPPVRRRLLRLRTGPLAAAAAVLLAVGICAVVHLRQRGAGQASGGAALLTAEVGLRSETESGLLPKRARTFATGDEIAFRVELRWEALLMLLHLGPDGRIVALPPERDMEVLATTMSKGAAQLGPFRLDDVTGTETFLIVLPSRPVQDVAGWVRSLQAVYDRVKTAEAVKEAIENWPAEVRVISLEHVAQR